MAHGSSICEPPGICHQPGLACRQAPARLVRKCGAPIPSAGPPRGARDTGDSSSAIRRFRHLHPPHRSVRTLCHRFPSAPGGRTLGELLFDANQYAWEREISKALLVKFLKSRGVSTAAARQAVNKSSLFVAHLLSLLYANFQGHFRAGRELTTAEIVNILQPYLESLALKHKEGLIDVFSSFPDAPKAKPGAGETLASKQDPRDQFQGYPYLLSNIVDGKLRSPLLYLLSLGLSESQVEVIVKRFPAIVSYNVEGNLKPTVEVILSFGVAPSDIPKVVAKRPTLLGCSVEDNLRPTMAYLESLGVERGEWPRMLVRFPHVLTFSHGKIKCLVDFLMEFGVAAPVLGKLLSRFPNMTGYSVEGKLRPIAEYLRAFGIEDFGVVVVRSPQVLGLSLEQNIKPTVEFLQSLGLTQEDVATMLLRFPQLLGLNVPNNMQHKAELLVDMGRQASELVDFPQYFGYSLENRIRPRLQELAESGFRWTLNRTLSPVDGVFRRVLEKEKSALSLRTDSLRQGVDAVLEPREQHVPSQGRRSSSS